MFKVCEQTGPFFRLLKHILRVFVFLTSHAFPLPRLLARCPLPFCITRQLALSNHALSLSPPSLPLSSSFSSLPFFLSSLSIPKTKQNEILPKMAGRQTMKWDAGVHQDMLVVLFQHVKLNTQDWEGMMKDLHDMGYTFSESALRYGMFCFVSCPHCLFICQLFLVCFYPSSPFSFSSSSPPPLLIHF